MAEGIGVEPAQYFGGFKTSLGPWTGTPCHPDFPISMGLAALKMIQVTVELFPSARLI